jgi:hypothetical protein
MFAENQFFVSVLVYFWDLHSVPLSMGPFLGQGHAVLGTVTL